jgi:hypothetical protein
VNRCWTDARAFIAKIFRTMKREPDRATAIDAGSRAIVNHANGDFAQYVVGRL